MSKYADHLPLHRKSQIFERHGLDLYRSTLADWVSKMTTLLAPLSDAIGKHALKGKAIFTDDTPVNMLGPGTGKTKTGHLWVYARDERPWGSDTPPPAWYQFSENQRRAHPKDHFSIYRGWMHAETRGHGQQRCTSQLVSVFTRPQRTASQRSPRKISGLDACGWVCPVR